MGCGASTGAATHDPNAKASSSGRDDTSPGRPTPMQRRLTIVQRDVDAERKTLEVSKVGRIGGILKESTIDPLPPSDEDEVAYAVRTPRLHGGHGRGTRELTFEDRFEDDHAPPPLAQLVVACATKAGTEPGRRGPGSKVNQDAYLAQPEFLGQRGGLFAVFDGHGPQGHLVSGLARARVPALVHADRKGHLKNGDAASALREAFVETDAELKRAKGVIDVSMSGSTAVACLLRDDQLTTAWAGDSRAVLGRWVDDEETVEAVSLTTDHKPDDAKERSRIERAGGRVMKLQDRGVDVGPYRVWVENEMTPGLAMSRALGDSVAAAVGVVAEPDTRAHAFSEDDRFLIVASDGLWEFVTNEEAVERASQCDAPDDAAQALVKMASERWKKFEGGVADDITVVVVAFAHYVDAWSRKRAAEGARGGGLGAGSAASKPKLTRQSTQTRMPKMQSPNQYDDDDDDDDE